MTDTTPRPSFLDAMTGPVSMLWFTGTLLVLLTGGALVYRNVLALAENRRSLVQSYQVIGELQRLLSTLTDAETGQRGYLLAGDPQYLEPYRDALARVTAERTILTALTRDDPEQRVRLEQLAPAIDARLRQLNETVALMDAGNRAGALDLVRTDAGKAAMDEVRRRIDVMESTERASLSQRAASLDALSRRTAGLVAFTTGLGVALVALVAALVRRRATERLHAARAVADYAERLRTTLASIGEGVIATDADGRITTINAVAESLTGWTEAAAVGQPLEAVFHLVNEDSRQAVDSPVARALREGPIVDLANHTVLLARDGTERPIDDSAAPIRNADGKLAGCVLVFHDITKRRRDEALLAERERAAREALSELELIYDAAPVGMCLLDRHQRYVRINQRLADINGLPAADHVGRTVHEIVPHLAEESARVFAAVLSTGRPVEHFEMTGETAAQPGVTRTWLASWHPWRNAAGEVAGVAVMAIEITARKQAELALLESTRALQARERFLARVLSASPSVVYIFDVEARRTVFVSEQARLALGLDGQEIEGAGDEFIRDRVHPEDQPGLLSHIDAMATLPDGEVAVVTYRLRDASGAWRTFDSRDVIFSRGDDGRARQILGVASDVTARRDAERRERQLLAAAATSNAKFQVLFEQSAMFVGILGLDGTLHDANRLACEGCGFAKAQVIGRPFWDGPWWTPSAAGAHRIRMAVDAVARGEPFAAELPYFLADGSERMVAISIVPIVGEGGEVRFLAATGVDVTERTRTEQALRRLAGELSQVNRRKDEFLATLAHELRNPLAPIRTGLHLLKESDARPEVHARATAMLDRQVAQLVRLVDDLLDASRISSGKLIVRKSRIDLARAVQQGVETSRPALDANGQVLSIQLPTAPIEVEADGVRLGQVFTNLLNNAAKYTPPGGRITLTLDRDGDEAVIRVQDEGDGMPADRLDTIFELFEQLPQTAERGQAGLGIGLSLARRLVELHGGTIAAHSDGPGTGSTFTVRLPIAPPVSALPSAVEVKAPAPPPPRRRILVADDNADAAESLAMMLELLGHDVKTAADGAEALVVAKAFRPQVALFDIGMPVLDGYEACRRLRAEAWGRAMTVVALTGWGQEDDRRRSEEAGFDRHLVKPVDPDDLAALVATSPLEDTSA